MFRSNTAFVYALGLLSMAGAFGAFAPVVRHSADHVHAEGGPVAGAAAWGTSGTSAPARRDVRLANGVRIRYVTQGPPDGPAILMLHGYTDSSFSFSRVMPLMARDLRVIALDQRGHGDSDRPASGYSMDDLAGDAIALMDALNIRQATLVGHSMGSFVARRIAATHPDRVTRLVLVGAGISGTNQGMRDLRKAVAALTEPVDATFVRDFQVSTVNKPVPADFMDRVIAESRKLPVRVWNAALDGLMGYPASEPAIRCPTLVLGGDKDGVFSTAEQEAVGSAIQGASVSIIPGIGHTLHWEAPQTFVDLLTAFMISRSNGRPDR